MVTKYSESAIDNVIKLLNLNQISSLKVWKSGPKSKEYMIQYTTLGDILNSNDREAYFRTEKCVNNPISLTNSEKACNMLKEFKSAMNDNRVYSFYVNIDCFKRENPSFSYGMSFGKSKDSAKDELIEQKEESAPEVKIVEKIVEVEKVVEKIVEVEKEPDIDDYLKILMKMSDSDVIPNLYYRIEVKNEGSKKQGRRQYKEITIKDLKEKIMSI